MPRSTAPRPSARFGNWFASGQGLFNCPGDFVFFLPGDFVPRTPLRRRSRGPPAPLRSGGPRLRRGSMRPRTPRPCGFFPRGIAGCRFAEQRDFLRCEIPELTGPDVFVADRSDAAAAKTNDRVADCVAHVADLAVASLAND